MFVFASFAVLVAYLAITAFRYLARPISRRRCNRPARKDTPPSSPTSENDTTSLTSDSGKARRQTIVERKEMVYHKSLYHKLHTLEDHPEILPECWDKLVSLLGETVAEARNSPAGTILSVADYTPSALTSFLASKDHETTEAYEAYITRRRSGGPREMFADSDEASWWLRQSTPVKYVDGAWLGHVGKPSSPFALRGVTKNAWQVMSEELGDGELEKNHVHLYRQTLESIGVRLPEAYEEGFVAEGLCLDQPRVWKAAVAQLLISLFPNDFLPELLGFNMAYESLPLHLLKSIKELNELKLNSYYFALHVSIDNGHSGHSAMAAAAVDAYLEQRRQAGGDNAVRQAWRRVQAGYILAEGLPTTPETGTTKAYKPASPSSDVSPDALVMDDKAAALLRVFAAKASVAQKIHCNSRLKIGRRTLVEWLDPVSFADPRWQKDFLQNLSNCRPWVFKGDSAKSRLVTESSWEGRMFGAFTQTEMGLMRQWIDSLDSNREWDESNGAYWSFTHETPVSGARYLLQARDVLTHYPVFYTVPEFPSCATHPVKPTEIPLPQLTPNELTPPPSPRGSVSCDAPLLSTLPIFRIPSDTEAQQRALPSLVAFLDCTSALLSNFPNTPSRVASTFGSAIIRALRAQAGFDMESDGVTGMDEARRTEAGDALGIIEIAGRMARRAGVKVPGDLAEAVKLAPSKEVREACEWCVAISTKPVGRRNELVGLAWAVVGLYAAIGSEWDLAEEERRVMLQIRQREEDALAICISELDTEGEGDVRRGVEVGCAIADLVLAAGLKC